MSEDLDLDDMEEPVPCYWCGELVELESMFDVDGDLVCAGCKDYYSEKEE